MPQIVSDNFNRADGALGANWTTITGQNAFTIVSNQAENPITTGSHGNTYTGASWTGGADHYTELTVKANPAQNDGGPTCRAATAAQTYYVACINNNDAVALGSSQRFEVFRVMAGVFTQVGSTVTMVISANDVLRCEAQGTTIRGLVNGVQKVTGTDSSIASGKPGMEWWHGSAGTSQVDDFAAGDFTTVGAAFTSIEAHRPAPFAPSSSSLGRI